AVSDPAPLFPAGTTEPFVSLTRRCQAAIAADPDNHWPQFQYACLLVQIGDSDRYRDHCNAMLRRFGDTEDRRIADRVAKASLLVARPGIELRAACGLADRAVADPNDAMMPYLQISKGMAEFRRGAFSEAADW